MAVLYHTCPGGNLPADTHTAAEVLLWTACAGQRHHADNTQRSVFAAVSRNALTNGARPRKSLRLWKQDVCSSLDLAVFSQDLPNLIRLQKTCFKGLFGAVLSVRSLKRFTSRWQSRAANDAEMTFVLVCACVCVCVKLLNICMTNI